MSEAPNTRNKRSAGRMAAFLRMGLRQPLSFYLTLLLLIAIVPSFVFSLIILKRSSDEQERVITALLKASTGSVTRVVEREIDGFLTTLRVLSTARSIESSNLALFYEQAASSLAETGSNLLLIDRNHNQIFNTRVPFGTTLGKTSNPDSVDKAFATDGVTVSNVFFGRTAKKWVYNVYLPVIKPQGRGDYLLTLTQDADSLSKAVNKDVLSPGWNAALLDDAGNVIVSSDPAQKVGQPFFLAIVPALRLGVGEASHAGVPYRTVTEFSATTGWRIIAWAKTATVDAPAWRSYLWLTLGGVIFGGLAIAGSVAIARLLTQGVRVLERDARRLGAGQPVAPRKHWISEIETVSNAFAEASQARIKAEGEVRFLMREVAHRSKNQLTVIQSMLNQSLNSVDNRQDFAEAFRKRIAGLARSTDLMIANAAQGVDMRELAQNQLQPFVPDDPKRVRLSGPPVRLDTQVSQTLGMALHELATNATKYGALANNRGIVDLTWSVTGEEFLFVWLETDADIEPSAEDAAPRKGFGSMVLERMLAMALDARLQRLMHEDGIEWRVTVPKARLNANLVEAP